MIQLFDQQKYIKIVKTIVARWVRGKSSLFFVVHDCVGEHGEEKNNYLGFKIALVDFHAYYYCLCVMLLVFLV